MTAVNRKWVAPAAAAAALTSELNNLANGAYSAASAAIDNTSNLYQYIWFEVVLASLTAVVPASVSVYLVPSLDDTNYADGGGSVAPSAINFVCSLVPTTGASAKRMVTSQAYECPPLKFKLVLLNNCGNAFAAANNTLSYRLGYEQAA